MKERIFAIILISFLSITAFSQEDKKRKVAEIDSIIHLFLPANWLTVNTDSSIHVYFSMKGLSSWESRDIPDSLLIITDSSSYGPAFYYQVRPDSIVSKFFSVKNFMGADKKKLYKLNLKNYQPNNILKIDIYIENQDQNNNLGYQFKIETSMEQFNSIYYLDETFKHPHYGDKLSSELIVEYNWLYLSLRLFLGFLPE
ncbi:hypothetical protein K6119_08105 [Paracrocinitomix mangrovi]|uniref:hypothetical protein n=1 Tax=Paracrocinitomix mangrovi TaxID=2862509 RepID=UPI001C8E06E8|nr:hypothetical protein [Paracrocinitomix mangrovi]UKN03475.1 hypothetical protein K6119_08105 [Paracrocinitomix mangrovi]